MAKETPDDAGRFAYDGLDRVLHEKARLGIMTSLAGRSSGLSFAELKSLCRLTDGNLSRHLDVLVRAGFVEVAKSFLNNRPHTACRLTPAGRRRFRDYLAALEQVLQDARGDEAARDARTAGSSARPRLSGA